MRRPRTLLTMAALAFGLALGGCESFDPESWFNTKKPLPGERKAVFPDGVPGVPQGVPPELVRGYQPPPEPPPPPGRAGRDRGRQRAAAPASPASPAAISPSRRRRCAATARTVRPHAGRTTPRRTRAAPGRSRPPPGSPQQARSAAACRTVRPRIAGIGPERARHELHRRHRRPAERRQVDPVQPAGRHGGLALVDDRPGVTRDRREGEARLGDLQFTAHRHRRTRRRRRRQPRRPHAGADQGRDRAGRRGVLPDRRAHRTVARRSRIRRSGAPLGQARDRGRQQGRGQSRRSPASSKPIALGLGEPVAISAEHGEGLADLFEALRAALPEATAQPALGRRPTEAERPADPRRRGRAAELRQVDTGQPADRRGAAADRSRGRHHPRRHRGRSAIGAAGRFGCTTPPGCGGRRRCRKSSKSFRSPTPSTPSASPRWWCC